MTLNGTMMTDNIVSTLSPGVIHYTFVATTGRSGTLSLARLFSRVPGYLALHEPAPDMTRHVVIETNNGNTRLMEDIFLKTKLPHIRRDCEKSGAKYYLESTHMFIKTFWRIAIDYFYPYIRIIQLERDPLKVAASFYQLGEIPGTQEGNDWLLDYKAPLNHIQIASILDTQPEFGHPFFRCLWYIYEIRERINKLKRMYPTIPIYRMNTEDLNSIEGVEKVLEFLGIPMDINYLSKFVGKHYNRAINQKKECSMPELSWKDIQAMYLKLKFLLCDLGIDNTNLYNN